MINSSRRSAGLGCCRAEAPISRTDPAYIENESARIATAKTLEADKVINRESRKLAKEQRAQDINKGAGCGVKKCEQGVV